MISVKNITKHYTVQGQRKTVFENLSLDILKGTNLALLGRNGAGKSTLLRIIAGIELPNKGSVSSTASISWPIGIASGFQPYMTGRENIQFLCRLFSSSRYERQEKIKFAEEFCELGHYFDMPLSTYSSGMRARLGFGASFAFDFEFYIVDEAMSTGDARFKKKCREVFEQKMSQSNMILVSHSMSIIRQFANKAILLSDGKLRIYQDIDEAIGAYEAGH